MLHSVRMHLHMTWNVKRSIWNESLGGLGLLTPLPFPPLSSKRRFSLSGLDWDLLPLPRCDWAVTRYSFNLSHIQCRCYTFELERGREREIHRGERGGDREDRESQLQCMISTCRVSVTIDEPFFNMRICSAGLQSRLWHTPYLSYAKTEDNKDNVIIFP